LSHLENNKTENRRDADSIAEEIENLLIIKSLITGKELIVNVVDYSWLGSVFVVVILGGVEQLRIDISSQGYQFIADDREIYTKLRKLVGKGFVNLKSRDALIQTIRRFVL